jgi:hypothetical protein
MQLSSNTVLGIITYVRGALDLDTEGLLRLGGTESSIDMFFFKVFQYIELESSKPKPDYVLKFFDFDGYTRDWVSPTKENSIDSIGHITLADIVKMSVSKLLLPKRSALILSKLVGKRLSADDHEELRSDFALAFFEAMLTKQFDSDSRSAILSFIEFGRAISDNSNNRMGSKQTAKMMAPCFMKPIIGNISNSDTVRIFSAAFLSMLEYCYDLPEETFRTLVDGGLKQKPKKKFSFPSFIGSAKSIENKGFSYTEHKVTSSISGEEIEPKISSGSFSDSDSDEGRTDFSTSIQNFGDEIPAPLIFALKKLSPKSAPTYTIAEIANLIHENDINALNSYFASLLDPSEFINSTKLISDRSFLHIAVLAQKPDVIMLLKDFGAKIVVLDRYNRTPLHYAANWAKFSKEFCEDSLNSLFTFDDAYIASKVRKDKNGKTAIKYAEENGIKDEFLSCRKPLHTRLVAK